MIRWCLALCLWSGALAAGPVTDVTGQRVTLDRPAGRVVSLAPHLTELMYAVGAGDRLVGVSAWSDYPPAATSLPRVSDHLHVDFERLQSLRPDLVLVWQSGMRPGDLARLRALKLPIYLSEPRQLPDIARNLRDLGVLVGAVERAEAAATAYERSLAALRARYEGRRVLRVFYQISERPLMTVNGAHLITQALQVCGARNLFADLPALATPVSIEAVVVADPDVIIIGSASDAGSEVPTVWRGQSGMRAVRDKALRSVPADLLHRATPRLPDGIGRLCEVLDSLR